jgi:hypothetical protein
MRRARIAVELLVASITCCAAHAYAGMIGTSVTSQYYDNGTTYSLFGSPSTFVANGTVQESFCGSGCPEGFDLTITDNQIDYVLFGSRGFWSESVPSLNSGGLFIANGNLLTFSGISISSVTLDGSSDVPGFTAANVTFNANNVAINWAGVTGIAPGDAVVLDVTSSSPSVTPEPATWINILIGFAGVGLRQRFRRRSAA